MELGLKDKVIMVAAGSKGLGYGIAEACASEGAVVCIGSRNKANVESAMETLAEAGAKEVMGSILDAKSKESIEAWAEAVLAQYGRVDGLVINAGGPPAGRFADFGEAAWYDAFELTLMSSMRMLKAVLPTMQAQKSGSVVAVTSLSVKEPIDVILLSNVMRSGVTSLMKSVSKDVAKDNVRLNTLIPGSIHTDRIDQLGAVRSEQMGISAEDYHAKAQSGIPMGRYGTPQEFGQTGAFLLSDAASYISGASIVCDGAASKTVW